MSGQRPARYRIRLEVVTILPRRRPRTVNGPAVRGASRGIGVPELGLEKKTLHTPASASLSTPRDDGARTPGDSKQQRSVCLVVLWQDVGPLVEHPELMRLVNKFIASTGLVSDDAIAEPARAPKARVAASILKSTASGECG